MSTPHSDPHSSLRIRLHGDHGPFVIALHGGPGAPGSALRLAQGLSRQHRVIEPWQRRSGDRPLTVAAHVEDLHELIGWRCKGRRPALVGSSWGAMLGLAYAAAHPDDIEALVLVGCGTFDEASRQLLIETRMRRIREHIQEHPEHAPDLELDAGALMMKWHRVTDTFETAPDLEEIGEPEPFDMRGHAETWEDMLRCRRLGIHPQSFVSIKVPTLMLHGEHDPHPGPMIRESLRRYIPQLEYRELERCGHEPEIEMHARDEFFSLMNAWLAEVFGNEAEA